MCLEKFLKKKNVLSKSARIILLCFLHTELLGYPKIIIENKLQKKSLWIFFLYQWSSHYFMLFNEQNTLVFSSAVRTHMYITYQQSNFLKQFSSTSANTETQTPFQKSILSVLVNTELFAYVSLKTFKMKPQYHRTPLCLLCAGPVLVLRLLTSA